MADKNLMISKIDTDQNTEIAKMWLCQFKELCRREKNSSRKWPSKNWCLKHGQLKTGYRMWKTVRKKDQVEIKKGETV